MQDHNLNPIMTNRLHLDPPSLRGPSSHHLLGTGLADLVGADPLALDRPSAVTLVVRIVAGKVAVLDQAAAGMPALEMDDFELRGCVRGRFRQTCDHSLRCPSWEITAYLAHDCEISGWVGEKGSSQDAVLAEFDCFTRCWIDVCQLPFRSLHGKAEGRQTRTGKLATCVREVVWWCLSLGWWRGGGEYQNKIHQRKNRQIHLN